MALPQVTSLGGCRVLFVMAALPEYGPRLQAMLTPLICGVGPIEAAITLTEALSDPANRPDLVVSLGSAGSARLEKTKVYQASQVAWRDMDASAIGFAPGVTPFLDLPAILPLPLRIPGLAEASLSTGANVVSGKAGYAAIAQDMVDMETFALWRACQRRGLPLIALRGISDGDADLGGLADWKEYLHVVDENLAHAVTLLERALLRGGLAALEPGTGR